MKTNRESLESLARFCRKSAHKLNNQISILKHSAEFIAEEVADNKEVLADLDRIRRACDDLSRFAEKLVRFSGRAREWQPKPVEINKIVMECLDLVPKPGGVSIQFELKLNPDVSLIFVDETHLREVFWNLVRNAIEAMPNGGQVTLATRNIGECVEFRISDTGMGIDPEHQSLIFEPYFSTKTDQPYRGFGLSLVYSTIVQNKGEIDFTSICGKGSEFIVRFPRFEIDSLPDDLIKNRDPKKTFEV